MLLLYPIYLDLFTVAVWFFMVIVMDFVKKTVIHTIGVTCLRKISAMFFYN